MKKLGFWSIVLLAINSIIGSGIFLSPGSVIKMVGNKAPLVYCLAAAFAIILSITFASAAKYVSKSGAAYAYARSAFGENIGFYVGITRFVAAAIAWGVMATGVVKSVLSIFGMNSNDFILISLGFILLMILLFLINLGGPGLFKLINNLSTLGKLLALVTTVLVGAIIAMQMHSHHLVDVNSLVNAAGQPLLPKANLSILVMGVITSFYAFTGFESVASGAEDMENPEKNLPRAIPLAIFIIAVIYIGIIIVSMMINPRVLIETNEVVALTTVFDDPIIRGIILYGALISMLGINVAASFHTPRLLEAMAKDKQISPWFNQRTSKDFPLRAFIITIVIAIVVPMAFKYNMTNIIILSSISRFIQFLIVPLAVICFYYGRNQGETLQAVRKNFWTDVLVPIFSLIVTVFLLIKFDWVGQFTSLDANHVAHANIYAISAMVIGYIILPLLLFALKENKNILQKQED
ncbi:APC family permease [Lactococcus termiticola]|uniref:Amino acid permease n=1 Tax=Lactococcus termiticola TaxID=2169526 RepID=A0A2R5HKR3_9LACT|nr:APC family permease [Lactococcus termiticola]GBG97520.1 amino acid permease [Lactococcus termiticola]